MQFSTNRLRIIFLIVFLISINSVPCFSQSYSKEVTEYYPTYVFIKNLNQYCSSNDHCSKSIHYLSQWNNWLNFIKGTSKTFGATYYAAKNLKEAYQLHNVKHNLQNYNQKIVQQTDKIQEALYDLRGDDSFKIWKATEHLNDYVKDANVNIYNATLETGRAHILLDEWSWLELLMVPYTGTELVQTLFYGGYDLIIPSTTLSFASSVKLLSYFKIMPEIQNSITQLSETIITAKKFINEAEKWNGYDEVLTRLNSLLREQDEKIKQLEYELTTYQHERENNITQPRISLGHFTA